ncbi:energy transducer TonB [Lysobacter capsici]|uniref:Ferric siderophore transport system, periplasmic binding protein TonB n=1 Tax=Lysobacter capsici AZ78 TaxID=1444315 RepID=A0A108U6Z8_9GAMM|nr:energy transducer TonB [Lysobacter capsici]ALN85107.1 tonB family C-terminal domain protein [Lysobacter capsici]KWS03716.1 Ferric siderophore transport system, periplasmic binding protein TonB [Lysobacter capsici AZ78]UOF16625.1 energy transducer TonB [Lysobacter capsici]WND82308.1 energy transducer TonB [Lysobacter capsici]WND87504.1 energy transducer TonB [Lysobacter capsici]
MVRAIPSHSTQLDGTRIAANAGAIAFNAAMLMLMLVPLSAPRLIQEPISEAIQVILVKPEKKIIVPPPPPLPVQQVVRDPKPRPTIQQTQTVEPPPIVVNDTPQIGDVLGSDTVAAFTPPSIDVGPQVLTGASLQALSSPPPTYPPQAVRENLTGVVELEILVGIDGKPIDVTVVRSSGHRLLDQAAIRVVKSRWKFQAAMSNGQPVQARGRVPIEFKLEQ